MENLSDKVPDMAVGTCLKILEKEGYIARSSEKTSSAFLRQVNNHQMTLDFISKQAKKQVEILNKLQARFDKELIDGWEFDLDEVAGIIETSREALVRSINAWKKADLVEYTPPKRGTEIQILKRVPRSEVKIDFSAMREKAQRAYGKLDEMEDYVYHFGCRPEYILNYFGEFDVKPCGKCDNCLSSPPYEGGARGGFEKEKHSHKERFNRPFTTTPKPLLRKEGGSADFGEIKVEKKTLNTKLTQLETLDLYNKGKSVAEIAAQRELAENTIYGHLEFLIEKKLIKDIDKLVDSKKQDKIFAAIKKVGAAKLTPIKDELGDDYSWEEIKIARAKFKSHNT
jgi:ATP-dependent DNA helicase RecQ